MLLQTLDIVAENPDKFKVVALAAGSNITLLVDQVNASLQACNGKFGLVCLSISVTDGFIPMVNLLL